MNRLPICMVLLLSLCASVSAQVKTEVSSFVHSIDLQSDTDTTQVTQWVSPLRAQIPVLGGHLGIRAAFMMTHQSNAVDEIVWGALDTRIDGRWSIGKNAVISLHASLPTGKRSLNVPDANTVGILARNDLGFPVRTFGQGLDLGGTLSVARHRGHWSMSAGIRVIRKGAYTPLAGATTYKPGDEVSGLIGIDYTYKRWIFQLNAAGSFYKMDRQGGTIAFRNGKQFLFQTGIFYMGRVFRLQAQLFEITRLKNLNISNGHPLYETRDSNGNDLRARFEASLTPVRPFTLFIIGNAKYLTSNAHTPGTALYRGDAHLLEGGGGFSLSLGTTQLSVRATQLTGKTEDNTVKLSAFNIRAALRFAL